jgi:hypothetical protein
MYFNLLQISKFYEFPHRRHISLIRDAVERREAGLERKVETSNKLGVLRSGSQESRLDNWKDKREDASMG